MPGLCEVCSKEESKYKCPTCGVSSCSLGCTRSHKIYCAPKQSPATTTTTTTTTTAKDEAKQEGSEKNSDPFQALFAEYPNLRAKLREIYRATQEEEWDTSSTTSGITTSTTASTDPATTTSLSTPHRRDRSNTNNNRGTWTAEKGFHRGVGKVRRWREICEGGECTDAEGFMKFVTLVTGERDS